MALALLQSGMAHWVCRYGAESEEWLQSFTARQLFSLSPLPSFHPPAPVRPPSFITQLLLSWEMTPSLADSPVLSPLRVTQTRSQSCTIMRVCKCASAPSISTSTCEKCCVYVSVSQCVFCIFQWLAVWLVEFARCELTCMTLEAAQRLAWQLERGI